MHKVETRVEVKTCIDCFYLNREYRPDFNERGELLIGCNVYGAQYEFQFADQCNGFGEA